MAADEIHVGDVGTRFLVTIMDGATAVDVSTATVKQILLKKPSGVILTKSASFVLTGADGRIQYFSIAGDLDLAGFWHIQAYVEMPAGKWHSDVQLFEVHANA